MRSLASILPRVRLLPLALAVTACPAGDDGGGDDTGADASSTSPATMTDATGDDTTASSSASTTAMTSSPDTGDTETATTDATGDTGADTCAALGCAPGEYCDWPLNSCGDDPTDVPACTATPPDGCPPSAGNPVCGCDGAVHVNECGAGLEGVDVRGVNDCTTPEGTFACGFLFCDPLYDYCQVSGSDIGGVPDGYSCLPLPAACGDMPSCACLVDEPCADFGCGTTPEGGLSVLCPGG